MEYTTTITLISRNDNQEVSFHLNDDFVQSFLASEAFKYMKDDLVIKID